MKTADKKAAEYTVAITQMVLDEAIDKASTLGVAPRDMVLIVLHKLIASVMDVDTTKARTHLTALIDLYDTKLPSENREALCEACRTSGEAMSAVIYETAKAMHDAKGQVKQ